MNMISELRQRVRKYGTATITAEDYDQLQAEWITRAGISTPPAESAPIQQCKDCSNREWEEGDIDHSPPGYGTYFCKLTNKALSEDLGTKGGTHEKCPLVKLPATPPSESDRELALSLLTECYGPVTENSVDFSTLKIAEKLVGKCRAHFQTATIPEARVIELAMQAEIRWLSRGLQKEAVLEFARLITREATGGKP